MTRRALPLESVSEIAHSDSLSHLATDGKQTRVIGMCAMQIPNPNDSPDPLKMWESEREESDRGYALVANDFVDHHLERLLRAFMVNDESRVNSLLNSPLRNMGNRAVLAYCLGLIGLQCFEVVEQIRNIRNTFGHSFELLTFESPEISKLCRDIRIPEYHDDGTITNRYRFELAVNELWQHLETVRKRVERRVVPVERFDAMRMDEPERSRRLEEMNVPYKRALGL